MAAPMKSLIGLFSRFSLGPKVCCSRLIHTGQALEFQATKILSGEPLKKKKRMDPAIKHAREARKRKKLEKEIKKLSKFSSKLKPIDELEGDRKLSKQIELRKRVTEALSNEEIESRALLNKEWSRYKLKAQHRVEVKALGRAIVAQEKALEELRKESEELYLQAVTLDEALIPYMTKGITDTPALSNYQPPDGEYVDTTKTFE